jgi:hypothetical protein
MLALNKWKERDENAHNFKHTYVVSHLHTKPKDQVTRFSHITKLGGTSRIAAAMKDDFHIRKNSSENAEKIICARAC